MLAEVIAGRLERLQKQIPIGMRPWNPTLAKSARVGHPALQAYGSERFTFVIIGLAGIQLGFLQPANWAEASKALMP